MRADVARDIDRADRAVRRLVWPVMEPVLGFGDLTDLARNPGIGSLLDIIAGSDYLVVRSDGRSAYTWASRVQYEAEWGTFTLRDRHAGTELAKRLDSWRNGDMLPDWTVHAYVSEIRGRFLSGAAVRTADLIAYHDAHLTELRATRRHNPDDHTPFTHIPWADLRTAGARLVCVGSLANGLCRGCDVGRTMVYDRRDTQKDGRCLACWRVAS